MRISSMTAFAFDTDSQRVSRGCCISVPNTDMSKKMLRMSMETKSVLWPDIVQYAFFDAAFCAAAALFCRLKQHFNRTAEFGA